MKKDIVSKKIVTILLIAFLVITTNVYAANDSFETTLTVNNTQVKAEDTVIITIGLSKISIESGEKGIGGYTGSIKFDSSVLEYVSTNGTDKWDAPFYENGLITAVTKYGDVVSTTQSIGTITFKVKKDAKVGDTTISLENFSGTTAGPDVATGNKSVKLTIVGDSNNNHDDNNGENNNTGNNNTGSSNNDSSKPNNNNVNKGQNTLGNKDNVLNVVDTHKENIKKGVLPRAGSANIILFTSIGIGILLTVVLYIKVKVIDRKIKKDK